MSDTEPGCPCRPYVAPPGTSLRVPMGRRTPESMGGNWRSVGAGSTLDLGRSTERTPSRPGLSSFLNDPGLSFRALQSRVSLGLCSSVNGLQCVEPTLSHPFGFRTDIVVRRASGRPLTVTALGVRKIRILDCRPVAGSFHRDTRVTRDPTSLPRRVSEDSSSESLAKVSSGTRALTLYP